MFTWIRDQHLITIGANDDVIEPQQRVLKIRDDLDTGLIIERRTRQWYEVDAGQAMRTSVVRAVIDHKQRRAWAVFCVVTNPYREIDALVINYRNDTYSYQIGTLPSACTRHLDHLASIISPE
jgi:hypothetical protein